MMVRKQSKRQGKAVDGIAAALLLLNLSACTSPGKPGATLELASAPAIQTQAPAADETPADFAVELSSNPAVDGSLIFITVTPPAGGAEAKGKFGEYEFPFFTFSDKGGPRLGAILGVPYESKPGPYPLSVELEASGRKQVARTVLQVMDGKYPTSREKIQVAQGFVSPSKKMIARIMKEKAEVGQIYARVTRKKYWDGPFVFPVKTHITSIFGTKRIFNGSHSTYHGGIDFKAPTGTRIFAPAAGEVVLAKSLYYTGNTVMIDHGYGLVSLYAHLSKLKVKKGQAVRTGDLLGLSGATGRATGAHLHWQVIVNRTKINPMGLLEVLR